MNQSHNEMDTGFNFTRKTELNINTPGELSEFGSRQQSHKLGLPKGKINTEQIQAEEAEMMKQVQMKTRSRREKEQTVKRTGKGVE